MDRLASRPGPAVPHSRGTAVAIGDAATDGLARWFAVCSARILTVEERAVPRSGAVPEGGV